MGGGYWVTGKEITLRILWLYTTVNCLNTSESPNTHEGEKKKYIKIHEHAVLSSMKIEA